MGQQAVQNMGSKGNWQTQKHLGSHCYSNIAKCCNNETAEVWNFTFCHDICFLFDWRYNLQGLLCHGIYICAQFHRNVFQVFFWHIHKFVQQKHSLSIFLDFLQFMAEIKQRFQCKLYQIMVFCAMLSLLESQNKICLPKTVFLVIRRTYLVKL